MCANLLPLLQFIRVRLFLFHHFLDGRLEVGHTTFALLLKLFFLCHYAIVFGFELLNTVLHTLNMQLELLLCTDVLANVSFQVLNQLLVHVRAAWYHICVHTGAALARAMLFVTASTSLSTHLLDFVQVWGRRTEHAAF